MNENEDKVFNKTVINWLFTINLKPFGTSCNIKEN